MINTLLLAIVVSSLGVSTLRVGSSKASYIEPFTPAIYVDLPSTIYATEGLEGNIYFHNVVRFDLDWSLITNTVTCTKGTSDGTKWTYAPISTDAGTTTFTLNVCRRTPFEVLFSKTVSLVTRAAAYPSSPVTRQLLIVGDSTSAGGVTASELLNLFDGDSAYTVTEVGPNTGNASDSDAQSRSVATSAIGGWTIGLFNTDSSTAWTTLGGVAKTGSPFVFGGAFDFAQFQTANSITMHSGDWVVVNLGINDMFGSTTDANMLTRIASATAALDAMIADMQAAVTGLRVGIALTIPPTQVEADFIDDYGETQTLARYLRNNRMWVEGLLSEYDNRTDESIYLIPINANIDTLNNMANGVHPANSGYYQIADTYRAFLKGTE